MKNSVTLTACGKLNLFLDIVGKRDDGYHLLEIVMQSVSVKDRLSFSLEKGTGVELRCDVPGIPTDGSNLIIKAVDRFCEKTGAKPDGRLIIDLKKNIPSMAGMGGGSADCAAALAAMNELSAAGLSMTELLDMAQTLGADVPFTLMGGTALCEGIGEMMHLYAAPEMFSMLQSSRSSVSQQPRHTRPATQLRPKLRENARSSSKLLKQGISALRQEGCTTSSRRLLPFRRSRI